MFTYANLNELNPLHEFLRKIRQQNEMTQQIMVFVTTSKEKKI